MAISDNLRGVGYMCLSMMAFTVNDALMKAVTLQLPLFQTVFLRGLITIAGLVVMGVITGAFRQRLTGSDLRLISVRSIAEVLATITFLVALLHMPLANLSAIMQALPLAVTLGAALFFGEKFGWRRLVAILVGFMGVLIIIRPGTEAFDRWSVMGVASVVFVVVRDLSVRRLAAHVPSVMVALGAALLVTLIGLGASLQSTATLGDNFAGLTGWEPVTFGQGLKVLGAGGCLIVGYLCSVNAMRSGDIGIVAPFRYTSLLWAIVLGFALFGNLPDGWTLIGSAIVVASGIYTLLRERKVSRISARA